MSERKWIEVSREGHGSGPWVMVAPVDARGNEHAPVAVNRSVLRDAPDDGVIAGYEQQLRHERDRVAELERDNVKLNKDINRWSEHVGDSNAKRRQMRRERDEARCHAREYMSQRDEARREAEEYSSRLDAEVEETNRLRAESERLRQLLSGYMPEDEIDVYLSDPGPHEAEDQPAPQTHYREGDVVLVQPGEHTYTLGRLLGASPSTYGDVEVWEDSCHPGDPAETVAIRPREAIILERDGTPTDEGLRRLAEKAGYREGVNLVPFGSGWGLGSARAMLMRQHTDDDRRALAAALRGMGGA